MEYVLAGAVHPLTLSAVLILFLFRRIGTTPTRKLVLFNVIVILLFFAIFDVLAAALSTVNDNLFRCDSPIYHHGLKPSEERVTRWGFGAPYRVATNSLGMLDEKPRTVPLKAPGKRIVIAGDSFVEGVGYPYEKTIPGIIARHLGPRGIEILNAGTVSYSPKLYYLRFKHLVEQGFFADDVYLLLDIGDIQDEIVYAYFVSDNDPPFAFVEKARLLFYQHTFLFRTLWDRFGPLTENPRSEFSPFWGNLGEYYRVRPLWTFDEHEFERWGKEGLSLALDYTDRLAKIFADHGIRFHISVHPWRTQIERRELPSRQQEVWQKFCEERGIEFIDLFPLFINEIPPSEVISRYFFPDDIHWNENGLALVAAQISQKIEMGSAALER